MTRIVVGVDGSEGSRRALRWALEEARLRHAVLDAVHVVPAPPLLADPVVFPPPPEEQLRAEGGRVLDEMLAGLETRDVEVQRIVAVGGAARVLCEASRGADLLVVGSRGLGGFKGLLVGSVAQQAIAHASCAIALIVPGRHPRE